MITDVRVQRPSESELELAIHALHGVLEALDWIDSVKIGVSEERLNDGRANLLIAGRLITEDMRRRI